MASFGDDFFPTAKMAHTTNWPALEKMAHNQTVATLQSRWGGGVALSSSVVFVLFNVVFVMCTLCMTQVIISTHYFYILSQHNIFPSGFWSVSACLLRFEVRICFTDFYYFCLSSSSYCFVHSLFTQEAVCSSPYSFIDDDWASSGKKCDNFWSGQYWAFFVKTCSACTLLGPVYCCNGWTVIQCCTLVLLILTPALPQ